MHIVAMAMGSDEAAILECMQAGVAQQKVFCWVYRAVLYVRVRGFMKHYWQEYSLKKKKLFFAVTENLSWKSFVHIYS